MSFLHSPIVRHFDKWGPRMPTNKERYQAFLQKAEPMIGNAFRWKHISRERYEADAMADGPSPVLSYADRRG